MHLIRRLIVWSVPLVWVAALELMRFYREHWWLYIACFLVYLFLVIGFVCRLSFNKNFWHFLILPVLLALGAWLCLIFFSSPLYFHLINVAVGLLLYLLINQYYLYFYVTFKYQPYSLESLSLYISLLAALFFGIAAFGGEILLQLPKYITVTVLAVFFALLTYQYFWINKYGWRKNWLFVVIIVLIMLELYSVVAFLPTDYFVNSLILTVVYYLSLSLSRQSLSETLTRKKVLEFLIVGGLCLATVLLSARWE